MHKRIWAWFRQIPPTVRWAIGVGLLLRLGGLIWIFAHGTSDSLVYGDATQYVELANNIRERHGFALFREGTWMTETFRTPGLPLLLLPFAGSNIGIHVYQVLMSIISGITLPLFLWIIGRRLFSERAGRIASWLVACEPLLVMFSWFPLTETPFLVLMLASIICVLNARTRVSWRWAVGAGALAGMAIMIRPGNLPLTFIGFGAVLFFDAWKKKSTWRLLAIALITTFVVLVPWMIRTQRVSGVMTLSATGWRNVYTDYLASIRAVEHNTTFWDEKANLKNEAAGFGMTKYDLNDPANSAVLRDVAVKEILAHPMTVLKLQTMIFISFFTNDGYSSYLMITGFVPKIVGRVSPTYVVLTKGLSGIGDIVQEMSRQLFIPVIGRIVACAVLLLAAVGWFRMRKKPIAWLIVFLIFCSALTSSAIGLGVESRLRLTIEPLLLLLVGAAFREKRQALERKDV